MDKQFPNHPSGTEAGFLWPESSRVGVESAFTAASVMRGMKSEIDPVRQQRVLERFCHRLCRPIDAFIRQKRRGLEAVRDRTYDFGHQRLSRKRRYWVEERRRQFRPPTLMAVQNFPRSKWDQQGAKKRDKPGVRWLRAAWTNTVDEESIGLQRVFSLASNP